MAKQDINLGVEANDGTGDSARVAGQKINENFTELYLDSAEVDTSGATITLDFEDVIQRIFVGNAAFTGAKVIAFDNNDNALVFDLHIEVTSSCTLTVPASWVMDSAEGRWNTSTQVLTLTGSGLYEITGVFDGTNWKVKASSDGGNL